MGAHLSTIQATVLEQFKKHDEGKKGYLILKEAMAIQTTYGINPCHIGVLYQIDRDHDGRFTLEELQAFTSFAHSYANLHRTLDASNMAAGLASLCMWRALREDSGRQQFVDWAMQLFMEGHEVTVLEGHDEPYVHRKALKALHVLFDMERNMGVDYQELRDMMQSAAEEQQLLDPENPDHDDWVPLEVLRLFTESLADGMNGIMESFFAEDAEDVLRGVESDIAAVTAAAAATAIGSPPRSSSARGKRGGLVPSLNLSRRLQV